MPAEDKTTATDAASTNQEQKKNNTSVRAILALAFAWVGVKISWLGTIADGASLLKGEPSKIRALGKLEGKLRDQVRSEINAGASRSKAIAKTFKYSLITTVIGAAAGAVLGWVRGNRVDSVKEVFHHPIKSLKLVLGRKPKESTVASGQSDTVVPTSTEGNTIPEKNGMESKGPGWAARTSVSQDQVAETGAVR